MEQVLPGEPVHQRGADASGGAPREGQPLAAKSAGGGAKRMTLLAVAGLKGSDDQFQFPETIYSAMIFMPMVVDIQNFKEWAFTAGECYIVLLLNYLLQGTFLQCIYYMWVWTETSLVEDCVEGGGTFWVYPHLWLASMSIHMCTCLRGIEETVAMCEVLCRDIPVNEGASTQFIFAENSDGDMKIVEGGISKCRRVMLLILVILPKLLIAAALLVIGGGYLAFSTSNSDLLLNGLAVTFVLDVDELLYSVLMSRRSQAMMSSLPAFDITSGRKCHFVKERSVFGMKLVIAAVALAVFYAATPFCDYWDSTDPWDPQWHRRP